MQQDRKASFKPLLKASSQQIRVRVRVTNRRVISHTGTVLSCVTKEGYLKCTGFISQQVGLFHNKLL